MSRSATIRISIVKSGVMAQVVRKEVLREFLAHEIRELGRIKQALNLAEHIPAIDNLVLAVVPVSQGDPQQVASALKGALRDSDVIFPGENYLLLLMPGTDSMGALHLLEGLADFTGEDFRSFVYAAYPEDGESPEELVSDLRRKARARLGLELP